MIDSNKSLSPESTPPVENSREVNLNRLVHAAPAISNIQQADVPILVDCITTTPGVCGGDRHVRGTRIPVWGLEAARRIGISNDRILAMYPSISMQQLLEAQKYADGHRDEMDRLIAENENG